MTKKIALMLMLLSISATAAAAIKWKCTGCTILPDGSMQCERCEAV